MDDTIKKCVKGEWLIWSMEHDGWWKPNRNGYTEYLSEAGRYSFEDALDIVASANMHCINQPKEAMIFDC